MQPEFCKNCHQVHQGNFCSHCGQKTKTARLDWRYLKDEVNYTILHFNKGFMFTVKELFTRPGDSIREFLEGKRVHHYKPILLVFVLAGINGYLSMKLDMKSMMQQYSGGQKLNSVMVEEYNKMMHWLFSHYALFEIVMLPLVSVISWISFKKWGYNYIENIIINSFASGQRLMFGLLSLLIYLILPLSSNLMVLMTLTTFGLTIWTYATLYRNHDGAAIFGRIALFIFLLLTIGFILVVLFSFLFVMYLVKTGVVTPGNIQ